MWAGSARYLPTRKRLPENDIYFQISFPISWLGRYPPRFPGVEPCVSLSEQRDRINAKEQRLEHLQTSLDWHDEMIRKVRNYGGNESVFVRERDQLLKEKWDLQR